MEDEYEYELLKLNTKRLLPLSKVYEFPEELLDKLSDLEVMFSLEDRKISENEMISFKK